MTKLPTQSVQIIGRRWFQRTYGNTYFSAEAYVDGERVASIDYAYGYGDHYVQAMTDKLEELGYMPDREHHGNGSSEPGWHYFRDRHGLKYNATASDVARKRDL